MALPSFSLPTVAGASGAMGTGRGYQPVRQSEDV